MDTRDPPVIQTAPSALQNISDTANRIVERLDEVLSDKNVASISATLALSLIHISWRPGP